MLKMLEQYNQAIIWLIFKESRALIYTLARYSTLLLLLEYILKRIMSKKSKSSNLENNKKKTLNKKAKKIVTSKITKKGTKGMIKIEHKEVPYEKILSSSSTPKNTLQQILFCKKSLRVSQYDFDLYVHKMNKSKIYGASLIDEYGRIIFVSKVAHEQFEGSLNNFHKKKFQDLIVQNQKNQILEILRNSAYSSIFKYVIYSKNAKRRYSGWSDISIEPGQIFYKYLKCLLSRIRPIEIVLDQPSKIPGFWNEYLIEPGVKKQYYFLQTRLAQDLPDLTKYNLLEDNIIKKFQHSNQLKKKQKQTFQNNFSNNRCKIDKESVSKQQSLSKQFQNTANNQQKICQLRQNYNLNEIKLQEYFFID